MSEWKARRFWKRAFVEPVDGGFQVLLDARPVRTPFKSPLVLPTEPLAALIAKEWDAQEGEINPLSMPTTRAANSAIDKVAVQKDAVVAELAGYGASDLICYRATHPEGLIARQSEAWDPWLAWTANALDAPLITTQGVMPIAQPAESLARLTSMIAEMDNFRLTGFHDLVAISGSLILAFAVVHSKLLPTEAWHLSRVDEDWQISEWGPDDEATAQAEAKQAAFCDAARFFQLCVT